MARDHNIFLIIKDPPLQNLLADGLQRHGSFSVTIAEKIPDQQDLTGKARIILLFDSPYLAAYESAKPAFHASAITLLPLMISSKPGEAIDPQLLPPENILHLPFRLGRLLDQISHYFSSSSPGWRKGQTIPIGPYTLWPGKSLLMAPDQSNPLYLTEKERDILVRLSQAKGQPVRRQVLLEELWGFVKEAETHTLETHIYRLRQKIEEDPADPVFILTDEQGYRLGE